MAMPIPNPPVSKWTTVRNVIADIVGPMAVLAIGAQKFISLSSGAALNAEKLRKALAASQGAEQLRKQFEVLGLSAEQARSKVEGVAKVASGSAFSFDSLATAAKNLQVLGGSSLSTAGMLRKVQDVAAATGAPVDNVATAVGEMYAALERGGSGAGAAAAQLASMGAISQATAQKISEISAAGGPAADSLRAMQGDLGKASGASAQMASSLSGLQSQLANLQNANDIKIGDMFLEGEKAGYRAAIAMEKLRGKIDEVASAPFAAISGQFSKLKESIAGMLGSDQGIETLKGLFKFLSTVAVAAVGVMVAQIIQLVVWLGGMGVAALKTAAGVKTLSGALSFAGGAMKNWATLLASATVRMNLYAVAIMLVVSKVLEARAAIDALVDAQKNLNTTNAKEIGGLKEKRLMVSTPEEKKAAMKAYDAAITSNDEALSVAKKERDEAAAQFEEKNSHSYNLNPLNWLDSVTGGQNRAAQELNMKEDRVQSLQGQGRNLRDERGRLAVMDSTTLGLDDEQDQRERAKLRLEKDIRKSGRQRVAALASPAQASGLIESELYDAEGKLSRNEKASQRSFEERSSLYTAQAGVIVEGDAGTKDFSAKGYSDSLDAMKQVDVQTESGRLSKDLAIRETLRNDRASTEGAIAQQVGLGSAADPETKKRLGEKLAVINSQIQAIGGEGEISGRRTQQLEAARDLAVEEEDPVKARQEVEAVKARKQQVDEAKSADKQSIDAGNRKLTLEKKLSAIKGLEGGDGKAAQMEGDEELKSLADRLQATKEVEKATAKFNASSEAEKPQAEKELNAVRVAAKGKGFRDGDTSDSVNLEVSGVKQITQLRQQQAAIVEAAAQRRRDDLMNEMKMTNQILQLRLSEAKGTPPVKTTQEIEREDRTRQREDLESAEGVVAERDAALETMENAGSEEEKKAAADLVMAKKKELEALGVDGNATAQDVSLSIRKNEQEEIGAKIKEAGGRRQAGRVAKITSLTMQEEYATTDGQRATAKRERERLEDEAAVESKAKSFRDAGFIGKDEQTGENDADKLAKNETEMERLASDIEKEKSTRVDSLTSVGGGSGFVGLTPSQDKMERLRKLTEEQNKTLERIAANNEKAFALAEMELKRDK